MIDSSRSLIDPIIEKIQVLSVEPGDVIVLTVPVWHSAADLDRLVASWEAMVEGTKLADHQMIITGYVEISVMRPDASN